MIIKTEKFPPDGETIVGVSPAIDGRVVVCTNKAAYIMTKQRPASLVRMDMVAEFSSSFEGGESYL